jgi:ABC-type sugar transport system ATPase subunit
MKLGVEGVSKRFGSLTAIEEISFDVPDGRFLSLLGPSGCGKSTILRMLAGLIGPTRGRVAFHGEPVAFPVAHGPGQRGIRRAQPACPPQR